MGSATPFEIAQTERVELYAVNDGDWLIRFGRFSGPSIYKVVGIDATARGRRLLLEGAEGAQQLRDIAYDEHGCASSYVWYRFIRSLG